MNLKIWKFKEMKLMIRTGWQKMFKSTDEVEIVHLEEDEWVQVNYNIYDSPPMKQEDLDALTEPGLIKVANDGWVSVHKEVMAIPLDDPVWAERNNS